MMFMEDNLTYDEMIDRIYGVLISLTEGEEDPELSQYYEDVISYCEDIAMYITLLEKNRGLRL